MNLLTAVEWPGGGCGGGWVHKVHIRDIRDPSSHPESCMWSGIGNESTVGKVKERLVFVKCI